MIIPSITRSTGVRILPIRSIIPVGLIVNSHVMTKNIVALKMGETLEIFGAMPIS